MEPWVEEMRRQNALEALQKRFPACICCDEPIRTERYLDLEAFGIRGYVCEDCMEENTGYADHLEPIYS